MEKSIMNSTLSNNFVVERGDDGDYKNPKTMGGTLKSFSRDTNIEGVNNAGRSEGRVRRSIWFLVFSVLTALTLRDIVDLVAEYRSRPVDVATTLSHENAIDFPSVAICNNNRVSCRRLKLFLDNFCKTGSPLCEHPTEVQRLFTLGLCGAPPPKPASSSQDLTLKPLKKTTTDAAKLAEKAKKKKKRKRENAKPKNKKEIKAKFDKAEQGTEFKLRQTFLMDYLQLTETERFMVGHQLRDLISGCTFRGLDCLTTIDSDDEDSFLMDYEAVWSPIYGNCFDIFAADESFGKSSLTGASYGLSLELQVEEEDYLGGGQTVASGFRVSIQERAGLPLVEEYGVDVNPGSLTSISLQLINITRHEYSNCTSNTWEGAVHGEQLAETSYSYSLTGCQRFCVQHAVEEECGCYHPLLPSSSDLRACGLTDNGADSECVLGTSIEFDIGKRSCECQPPCRELDYEKLVSSTKLHGASEGTARVEIYFMSLNVKSITETARYSLTTFIATIGGSMGAWVGFSVCMIFEVIELLIDLGARLCCPGKT